MSTNIRPDIACFSYLAAVNTLRVPRYPTADYGIAVSGIERFLAADGPIVAGTAAALGMRAHLISNGVADDEPGRWVLSKLRSWGVALARPGPDPDRATTPLSTVVSAEDGSRTFFPFLPDVVTDLEVADLAPLVRARTAYVDCYELLAESAERALSIAVASDSLVLANLGGSPAPPWLTPERIGGRITILQSSVPESAGEDARETALDLAARNMAAIVIVTQGCRGAIIAWQDGTVFHTPARSVHPLRTQGAGAVFSAVLLNYMTRGHDLQTSLNCATAGGSLWCAAATDMPPDALQLQSFMEATADATDECLSQGGSLGHK